jgi:choice-of-anchor C domain-containing protein
MYVISSYPKAWQKLRKLNRITLRDKAMKIHKLLLGVVILALVLAFGTAGGQAALITNGSFEDSSIASVGNFTPLPNGSTAITGWTVGGAGIDYIGTYWVASDGSYSLDMNPTPGLGTITSESFATTAGTTYWISFDLSGNPEQPPATKTLTVTVTGTGTLYNQGYTYDITGQSRPNIIWVNKYFQFTADSALTMISFSSGTEGNCGPALDNVQGGVVPIPGAILLLGSGLLRLAAYGRRKSGSKS